MIHIHARRAPLRWPGIAVLSGTVGRLGKSLDIQSIIEEDDAVQRVVNKIEVQDSSPLDGV